jgi:hypothetical protein
MEGLLEPQTRKIDRPKQMDMSKPRCIPISTIGFKGQMGLQGKQAMQELVGMAQSCITRAIQSHGFD